MTPIFVGALSNNFDAVELLLQKGVSVCVTDEVILCFLYFLIGCFLRNSFDKKRKLDF